MGLTKSKTRDRVLLTGKAGAVTTEQPTGTTGRRVVFYGWLTLITAGLAVMIVLPLAGR